MNVTTTTPGFAGASGKSSPIRQMFEKGLELKAKFGADAVCDFSLGNPDLPPPPEAKEALLEIASRSGDRFAFGYCPNAGLPEAREAVAARISREQGVAVAASGVVLTCGAAGALVSLFRATVSHGDEVVVPCPYFVEYANYCGHFGGLLKPVATGDGFALDIDALERAVTARTCVILLNSPNNPTGAIYSEDEIAAVGALVERVNVERLSRGEKALLLVSDEPYRDFAYDGAQTPSVMRHCKWAVVAGSFSKSLSLAGERIGYVAPNPRLSREDGGALLDALALANRTLGFVNAPIVGQRLAAALAGTSPDIAVYGRRRAAMARVLDDAGIRYAMPKGAFYFFPETPGGDDARFIDALLAERILAVPGAQFGMGGHFRLSYSVGEEVIARSASGFKRAAEKCR